MYLKLLQGNARKQFKQPLLILLLMIFLFSMLLYSLHRQDIVENQIEEAQTSMEIKGKVEKDPGQDYIPSRVYNRFTDFDLKPLVRDLALSSGVEIASGSLLVEGQALPQAYDYHELLGMSLAEAEVTLDDKVVWLAGYSAEFFESEELEAVLIPQTLYETLDSEVSSISLELLPPREFNVPEDGYSDTVISLNIAGYIEEDISSLICSWQALCNEHRQVFWNDLQYNYSLSFTLADNRLLEEFQSKIEEIRADILIYQGAYLERMYSLNRHKAYIDIIIPLIYIISLPVGIVTSFILLLERSKNIILMRVLGTSSKTIFLLNNIESLLYSLLSYALALLIISALGIRLQVYNSLMVLFLAVVFLLSTNIALFLIMRKNLIIEVKKEMTDE